MLITAIEPFKGSKYNIFVEGEYALTADIEIILELRLRAGQAVTPEDLEEIRVRCDTRRARERALYLLSFRDHSKKELSDKLRKNYDEDIVSEVVERLEGAGLLDDAAYARGRARDLIERKRYGEKRVRQELKIRGIASDIIDEVLSELKQDDREERLVSLIEAKYLGKLRGENGTARVTAALARMGYPYDEIRRALREFDADEEDESESF
ncbi:regulatory protein RecX [Zongyangia hominis]|uniref:Regulatory protein RecX n=1 Tax=Zongyangia hominis TaxID=2763677 RepID=A0A926EEW5_9FIRM|nr:regulatory protein RecX [Zongyangia hominis]MBC8570894.1 regulatory protein RecX [Zongyangia hominis]